MALTVPQIESKEFKISPRGYDCLEVDEFLDDICDEMVNLQEEIASLQKRLSQASAQVRQAPPSSVPAPADNQTAAAQEAAERLLKNAQRTYDLTLADARQEADRLVEEARQKADEIIAGAQSSALTAQTNTEKQSLEMEISNLRALASDYRERFLALLKTQKDALEEAGVLFDED